MPPATNPQFRKDKQAWTKKVRGCAEKAFIAERSNDVIHGYPDIGTSTIIGAPGGHC
jgi:hypothetical protein